MGEPWGLPPRFALNRWSWALVLPPLLFFLAFFVGPLLYLFFVSLHEASQTELYGSRLTLDSYLRVAADPFYLGIIRRTLTAGVAVSGLCLLIGYPVALSMTRMPASRRGAFLMLLLFPLMVSNVIRAYGWIAILGRRGVVNNLLRDAGVVQASLPLLYSVETVVVGLLTILLPYMIICLVNALLTVDRTLEEAAQALGAGPLRTFLHVTLPLSTPGIASGLLLVFLLTLSAYVTVQLLGGPQSKMLVSLVYDAVMTFVWPRAAALAFILLGISLAVTTLMLKGIRPQRVQGRG
ncbi:MAG TPA: ABC transporter permease [Candidatus Methylomirabilis sp.]|nr:ABC transporter permease [Candidatus Methylomirabilis sp.]